MNKQKTKKSKETNRNLPNPTTTAKENEN